jgi:predicted P-loop ATPase
LSIGQTTISIPGVSTCRKKGRLHPSLELFAGFGRVFYLAFDNDVMAKRQVQFALLATARELAATGSKVMVIQLPPGELKGMDDFIATKGEDAFNELVASALTIEEWHDEIKETWREQLEEIKNTKRSKVGRYMEIVRLGWGHELRYNQMKSLIELSGQPLDLNQVRLRIALEFDVDVPMQDALSIVEGLAKENSYHPVEDYLDGLAQQYPQPDLTILDDLAFRYFGTDEPLHNLYLRKTLIAAVARVKQPGCKHDTATILIGGQGIGKSTFWEKLFGRDWFTDELGDANEKDELMKLHRFWALEWAEFETVYKRKDVSSLKKFMTTRIDPIRIPYSRSHGEYPRQSVLVGTTNEEEILADPTGSRRFLIIPVHKRIPVDQLEEEREQIWAAAYVLYRSGETWYLNSEDSAQQEEMNEDYQTEDPWQEIIAKYIGNQVEITATEIFQHLQIDPVHQDMAFRKRIASVLRSLKWKSTRKRINGVQVRVWVKKETDLNFLSVSNEKKQNVGFLGVTPVTPDSPFLSVSNEKKQNVGFLGVTPVTPDSPDSPVSPTTSKGAEDNSATNDTREYVEGNDTSTSFDTLNPVEPLKTVGVTGVTPKKPTLDNFLRETDKRGVGFNPPLSNPIKIKLASPLGEIMAIATPLDSKNWEFHLTYPDGTEHREQRTSDEQKAGKRLMSLSRKWFVSISYRVSRITQNGYEWVEGCKCVETTITRNGGRNHTFKSPSGEDIYIYGNKDFEMMR